VRRNTIAVLLIGMAFYAGCTTSPRFTGTDRTTGTTEPSRYGGNTALLTIEGIASYYAHDFHGRTTANGERYDMYGMTAAHKSFPFDTVVRVHNLTNNNSVVVRINDRGPFVEGRILDLSLGAARKLGMIESGTTNVRLEVLRWGSSE
jgi:rare lipoprotein A